MIELKNCPFCGSEVNWCGETPEDEAHECHQISCNGCGAQLDVNSDETKNAGTMDELKQVMAKAWNSRA